MKIQIKRKILFIIFSCFIFFAFSQSDADIEIVFKNGEIKYGKGHFRYDSKVIYYSYEKRNKEIIIPFNEIKELYFFHNSYRTKYVNKKIKEEKYYEIMRELEIGKLSLYSNYEINNKKYFIQKDGSNEVTYIKIGLSNKKMKERLIPYIGKCEKLLKIIDKKIFGIRQIIRFYNAQCSEEENQNPTE